MRENLYRLWLAVLLLGLIGLVARDLFGETPVGIKVIPKYAIPNPYKNTDFYIVWTIERHPDNRAYHLSYDCGDYYASIRELDGENAARVASMTASIRVLNDCVFQICVTRTPKKVFCARQEVKTPKPP